MKIEELTIVGFEGIVNEVECGSELPVYCHAESNRYFIPSTVNSPFAGAFWFSREEFDSYVAEGRCTRLPTPMPAPPQAVALYVTDKFLQALPDDLPDAFAWQRLEDTSEPAWVTCGSAYQVTTQLDAWGKTLMREGDRLFTRFLSDKEQDQSIRQRIETIFRLARSAAESPSLRREIFVRYGAVRMHCREEQALRQMFELLQMSYPEWTWNDLQQRIGQYIADAEPQRVMAVGVGQSVRQTQVAAALGQSAWPIRQNNGHSYQTPEQAEASLLSKVRRDANTSHVELTQAEGDLLVQELAISTMNVLQKVGKVYLLNLVELLKQMKRLSDHTLGTLGRAIRGKLIET